MTEQQNAMAKFYIQQILMEVRYNQVPLGVRRITENQGGFMQQLFDNAPPYLGPSTSSGVY